jgi:hypothetical protein
MANSCKIDNIWRSVNKFFKKENGSWTEISSSSIESYVVGKSLEYGGNFGPEVLDEAFNPSGSHAANTNAIYTQTEGKPHVKTDESGKVTYYKLTDVDANGITGKTINSGLLALNGGIIRIHAVFDLTVSEQSTYTYIFGAYEPVGSNTYTGFGLATYGQYQMVYLYASKSGEKAGSSGNIGYSVGNRLVVPRARQRYTLDIEYTLSSSSDQGGNTNLSISPSSTGNGNSVVDTPATFTTSSSYIPHGLESAMAILGGNGVTNRNAENMTVYEFSIEKI